MSSTTQTEDLEQIAEGQSLTFTVGDGKTLKCEVVKTGKWFYSGSRYIVLEFKPCAGAKGYLRLDLKRLETYYELSKAVAGAFANRLALIEYAKNPGLFSDSVKTWMDWGNGWEWQEGSHSSQPNGFRCVANAKYLQITEKVPNRQPHEICYFAKSVDNLPFI